MRLRKLQVKGFKSFANDTVLNFNEDIIGVVGPNGSGKSNVVDAIRWVLGEQKSKELRLDKMTDVIFNGTRKKKQAPTAQVTLTFENDKGILPTEYNMVSVTRILYRSGDSEYRLNDVKCRLKDITTLLMDTGMGSNSYAIIALGMVDDILSNKDGARRHMFEQAAGISKYKKRKKDTLSKLKSTTGDLDRVEDLIFEIEGNLKSLEKQARRAQQYLDLKGEYKEKSILYTRATVQQLKTEFKKVSTDLETEKNKYRELDVIFNQKEAELEKTKKEHLDAETNLSVQQKKLNQLVAQTRDLESQKSLLEQKSNFSAQNKQNLERRIEANRGRISELKIDILNLEARLEEETENVSSLAAEVKKLQEAYDQIKSVHLTTKSSADQGLLDQNSIRTKIFEIEKSIALKDNALQNKQNDIQRRLTELQGKEEELSKSKEEFEWLESSIDRKNNEVEILLNTQANVEKEIEELLIALENIKKNIVDNNRIIDAKQNEYNLLKSMVDNLEGFPESVKYLHKNWDSKAPILSDLLDVEQSYRGVIEQYLEPYLNYYVVDKIEDAITAVDLLAKAQKGKANFFVLDAIPESKIVLAGGDPAKKYVHVDAKYAGLVNHILDGVTIHEGKLDASLKPHEGNTYLSKNGEYILSPYTVSGGSVGLFQGKRIGRKKALEKLSKEIDDLKNKLHQQEVKRDDLKKNLELKRDNTLNEDIKNLEKEINNISKDHVRLKLIIDNAAEYEQKIEQQNMISNEEIAGLKTELAKLKIDKDAHAGELEHLELKSKSSIENLEQLSSELSKASEVFNEKNILSIRQQNLLENLQRDLNVKNNNLENLEKTLGQDKKRIENYDSEIKEIKDEIEYVIEKLTISYEEKAALEMDLSEVERAYFEGRNVINEAENEVRKITRNQNQIQLVVQKLKDELNDVKFKITGESERIKIEFGISINDIINEEIEIPDDLEEIQARVEKLRLRLSKFGEVNPMAVETYNEMKERYETITVQRNDILEAKESLIKTIEEIEATASQQFMESFTKARENFIEVFRHLFTEDDDCDLVLVDPSNPLDSDIEIIAKPKGKKPKSLSQLSGGEKTLTATALLFSLYLLKPAPFCIFDEVDAPLDDANIQKFNRIIKRFSKDSQFIIVTHNKATMAAVDILYGVYMQEQGVSSVTPVDFRSYDNSDLLQAIG